jgi:hypothetical protein
MYILATLLVILGAERADSLFPQAIRVDEA